MNELHFLRINGTITREGVYQAGHGFEATQIPRCFPRESDPSAPCGYTMAISDAHNKQAWEGIPTINGGMNHVPGRRTLSGYIPLLHAPGFYEIRRYNQVVYRRPISANAPAIKITHWKPGKKHGFISWEARHTIDSTLLFTAACIANGKTYPLLFKSQKTSLEFDLSKIPGATEAHISVRAGDGCRSSIAISETFEIEAKPPLVKILEPANNSVFDATQPIAVAGIARDAAGTNLPFSNLQWYIEYQTGAREPINNDNGQLVLTGLPSGTHRIRLAYPQNKELFETSIEITINPLRDWEREWQALFSKVEVQK